MPGQRAQPVALGGQHEVLGARAPQRRGDLLALGGGRLGEALAHAAAAGVDAQLAAGLGIGEPEVADRRQLELARVADLDGEHSVAAAQRPQGRLPVAVATEVGDDDHEPAVAGERGGLARRVAERGRAGAVGLGLGAQLGEQREQAEAALARAHDPRLAAADRDDAEAVAAARRHVADRERDALGDVGLAAVGGAEGHRGGDVEQQPRGHRALADVHAHVRLAHARGHVPVDVAHVVAGPVGADHRQLGAAADLRGQVLARHQALHPPQHGEVERAQDGRRDRAGPGAIGRALGRRDGDAGCGGAAVRARAAANARSRDPPRPQQREDPAGQQQHERGAGEGRRDLLLLLARREARAEVLVDRLEPRRARGGEEAPAGRLGDVAQRHVVGRHRDRPSRPGSSVPDWVPSAIV